jgi:hypothetical protein
MSDPLNDFSQPDADLQPDGDQTQGDLQPDGDLLGSDDEEQVDENGDKVESDDTDVSLRDVAEGEQRASWG